MKHYLKPAIKIVRINDEHYILAASPQLHDETGNKTQLSNLRLLRKNPTLTSMTELWLTNRSLT